LSEAVAVIAGIAMQLSDEGCQIISSQCLFGGMQWDILILLKLKQTLIILFVAGLCVQETLQRNEIISLITKCEARTGWPMSTLCDELRQEWKRIDSTDDSRDAGVNMPP